MSQSATSQLDNETLRIITHHLHKAMQDNNGRIKTNRAMTKVEEETDVSYADVEAVVNSEYVTTQENNIGKDVIQQVQTVGAQPDDLSTTTQSQSKKTTSSKSDLAFDPDEELSGTGTGSSDNSSDDADFTELSQIGDAKADALSAAGFDSFDDIATAEMDELKDIPGIRDSIAETIKDEAVEHADLNQLDEIAREAYAVEQEWIDHINDTGEDNEAVAHLATEVDEPAGEPIGPDEHLYGLPVLEEKPDHPFTKKLDDYTPLYTRELSSGERDIELICRLVAKNNYGVNLIGHAGVGKDTVVKFIAAYTNRPMLTINMDGSALTEDLFGIHHLEDKETGEEIDEETAEKMVESGDLGGAEIVWKDGPVTRAVRYGWLLLIDEINAAPAKITMALHQLLERDSKLHIKERNEVIEPHPSFRFLSTMNPPEEGYNGANELNGAFQNRLNHVWMPYLPNEKEAQLVDDLVNSNRTILTQDEIEELVAFADEFRSERDGGNRKVPRLSPRDLQKIADKADGNISVRDAAVESVESLCKLSPRLNAEAATEIARDKINES